MNAAGERMVARAWIRWQPPDLRELVELLRQLPTVVARHPHDWSTGSLDQVLAEIEALDFPVDAPDPANAASGGSLVGASRPDEHTVQLRVGIPVHPKAGPTFTGPQELLRITRLGPDRWAWHRQPA